MSTYTLKCFFLLKYVYIHIYTKVNWQSLIKENLKTDLSLPTEWFQSDLVLSSMYDNLSSKFIWLQSR